jgi:cobalt-zinc-cadmium efflux system outer membrane protein
MPKLNNLVILVWFCIPLFGHADNDTLLSLDFLIEEAKTNNPELNAMMADYRAAGARVSGFRYLMDPIISVEFDGDTRMYSVSQEIPFPTKIATQSKYATIETDQRYQQYDSKLRSTIMEVKRVYADLYLSYVRVEAMQSSILYLKQVYNVTARKYSFGQASQSEVLRIQIELSKAENELLAARDEVKISESMICALVNRQIGEKLGRPEVPKTKIGELELQELYDLAREYDPRLKVYDLMFKKAELMKSMAQQTYLPNFMLGFSQMDGAMRDRKYMLGITVPLWSLGKQNNVVREAQYDEQKAFAEYRAMENGIMLSVVEAKLQVDKQKRSVELFKNSILPQAEAALKSALTEYQVNKVEFQHLLDNAVLLVQMELEYVEAQAGYFDAVAELEQSVGVE